ncbi:hypothetical protein [Piscirickettsia salmonis]|uniref:hypothetical protein n=1 Tax=Piscirickettsia salmonis TaxID=1238 RepID=UPI0012B9E644|nr:hypothetical protein [Piscirickettsia salmonis]
MTKSIVKLSRIKVLATMRKITIIMLLTFLCITTFASIKNIKGASFLFVVNDQYNIDNPYAGSIFCMSFNKNGSFYYYNFSKNETMVGHYTYSYSVVNKSGIGVINADNNDGYSYTMILIPKDRKTGFYVYKQENKGKIRMNNAKYILLSRNHNDFCKNLSIDSNKKNLGTGT